MEIGLCGQSQPGSVRTLSAALAATSTWCPLRCHAYRRQPRHGQRKPLSPIAGLRRSDPGHKQPVRNYNALQMSWARHAGQVHHSGELHVAEGHGHRLTPRMIRTASSANYGLHASDREICSTRPIRSTWEPRSTRMPSSTGLATGGSSPASRSCRAAPTSPMAAIRNRRRTSTTTCPLPA